MARIPEEVIEPLKEEVALERLVELAGVELRRQGKDLVGRCPFHEDRTPSLVITPAKNLWHCMGACQAGGSVIDWVMRAESVSFPHAVELLRDGVAPTPLARQRASVRSTVTKLPSPLAVEADERELLARVVGFYQQTLKESPQAVAYLERRGLAHAEMLERFRLGYANRTLCYRLPEKSRQAGALVRGKLQHLGVLRSSGHEHFSGSLVIPVCDARGEVVQLYGRKVNDNLRAGTPLHLYLPGPRRGVFNAAGFSGAGGELIVCESLIDALTFWVGGLRHVKTTIVKGLPGEETPTNEYDTNNRLTKGASTAYEYDAANNPTKIITGTYKYDKADELESGPSLTYTYDELGERTKTKPSTGPATTYGYDEAGNLISVERPKEGETPEIKDSYTYDGNGLRALQTISATTSYLTWDMTEGLPLILNDGTNSYIYGPGGLPIEQVSSGGMITYLHHDQQGSTRLLTGTTGTVTGSTTFDAYGNKTGSTGTATTPLGYDAQYTSTDTGLIYLRARVYDPSTAQFMSSDPLKAITEEPYAYAGDNPLNASDPTGLIFGISGTPSWEEIGEGIAGWGDTVTFGATNWVREELGINNINACSSAYQAGGYAGLATAALIPGEGEAEIGAEGVSISAKIASQMASRGWTEEAIQEAIESGDQVQAVNKATDNAATRYINPTTGQSVVVDDVTKEVIHVGGPGFKYGLGSGDLP